MSINQPKPLLSRTTRTLELPIHDQLMIPSNALDQPNMAKRKYPVPMGVVIDDIYDPAQRISDFKPKKFYDYDFYISGGMTGHEDFNFATFNEFARMLRFHDFRVFNPAENFGGDTTRTRSEYMRKDQSALTRCANILLLPSFNESEGATGELNNALSIPDMGIFMVLKPENNPNFRKIIIKLKR